MGLFDALFGKVNFFRTTVTPETEAKIKADWIKISQLVTLGKPSNLREALITADRSLDTALKELVTGENLGERLKNSLQKFDRTQYNLIWEAHKMRNALVHESGFEPPYFVLKKAIEDLRAALVSLGLRF